MALRILAINWRDLKNPLAGGAEVHLEENLRAANVRLTAGVLTELETCINAATVSGARYSPATQAEIDTEEQ